ncbi:MAG: alpha/beta hydrolase, partial [Cryobacterium sp.]
MTRASALTGRARMRAALHNAGSWLLDYGYALRWQARTVLSRTDPGEFGTGTAAPVLILPGVYERWPFMRPLIDALHEHGHPVHV